MSARISEGLWALFAFLLHGGSVLRQASSGRSEWSRRRSQSVGGVGCCMSGEVSWSVRVWRVCICRVPSCQCGHGGGCMCCG